MESVNPKPNQIVIEQLEEMMEEARSGKIQSMAGVVCFSHLQSGHFYSASDNFSIMVLLGEIEVLKREFMDNHVQLTRLAAPEYCE